MYYDFNSNITILYEVKKTNSKTKNEKKNPQLQGYFSGNRLCENS